MIGDVHGCLDELQALLLLLGYRPGTWRHPAGRRAVFLGDLVDRGPRGVATLALVRAMVARGQALAVPGNHDVRLARALTGRPVPPGHGLAGTLAELDALPAPERTAARDWIPAFVAGLPGHLLLDGGRLVVAHAGLPEAFHGADTEEAWELAVHGELDTSLDPPRRRDWARAYRGEAVVVYGHTPVRAARWRHRTIDIDTGCVFGGRLTALRWPERRVVAVPARRAYWIRGVV